MPKLQKQEFSQHPFAIIFIAIVLFMGCLWGCLNYNHLTNYVGAQNHQHVHVVKTTNMADPKVQNKVYGQQWKNTKQVATQYLSSNYYLTNKVKFNNQQRLIEIQVNKNVLKQIGQQEYNGNTEAQANQLSNAVFRKTTKEAENIKQASHASQVAIQASNDPTLNIVID